MIDKEQIDSSTFIDSVKANRPHNPELLKDIIAAYAFDTSPGLKDYTGLHDMSNHNVGILSSTTRDYYDYNGTTSYSSTPFNESLKIKDEITIMLDFHPYSNGQAGTSNLIGLFQTTGGNHLYHLGHRPDGSIRSRIYTTTHNDMYSNDVLEINKWSRIVFRWKEGEGMRIRINGGDEKTGPVLNGPVQERQYPLRIGMAPDQPGYNIRMPHGNMDNLVIWKRKLTDEETSFLFENNISVEQMFNQNE